MGRIAVYFEDDVEEWIRDKAAERGVSVSSFVRSHCELLSSDRFIEKVRDVLREEMETLGLQFVSSHNSAIQPVSSTNLPRATSHSEQAGCSTRGRRRPALEGVVR